MAELETVAKPGGSRSLAARGIILVTLGLIAVVGCMVIYERFGA